MRRVLTMDEALAALDSLRIDASPFGHRDSFWRDPARQFEASGSATIETWTR